MMLRLEVTVHPTEPPPPEPIVAKSHSDLKKYKFSWRTNMLAQPRRIVPKYEPREPLPPKKIEELDPDTEFRSDHLCRPLIRWLALNKKYAESLNFVKISKTIDKTLEKSWNSIYNYYKKRLRERKLKRLRRIQEKRKQKKKKGKSDEQREKERDERFILLSTPKPVLKPEPLPKKWKPLDELITGVDRLAEPREYHIPPPIDLTKVNPAALSYEITETVLKLAQLPERMKKRQSVGLLPGQVQPGALHAIATPRILELARPVLNAGQAQRQEEDKMDPWVISKNALKYKATPRILELAKPVERD